MSIVIESETIENKKLKVTDIVVIKGSFGGIGKYMVITKTDKYALICIELDTAAIGRIGNSWSGWFDSLEDLYKYSKNSILEHYSSDEYELLLQKKKKC